MAKSSELAIAETLFKSKIYIVRGSKIAGSLPVLETKCAGDERS